MPRGQSEFEAEVAQTERETADPAIQRAREQLAIARERMLSAALAFTDGTISAGQLRAVREAYKAYKSASRK